MKKMVQKLDIVIEKDLHGYFARCRNLDGCFAQGKTRKEVVENIADAITLHLGKKDSLDQELAQTLEDVRKGNVIGPFNSAKEMLADLDKRIAEIRKNKRRAKAL